MPFFAFLSWGVCGAFLENAGCQLPGWYPTSVIMLIPYILILTLNQ